MEGADEFGEERLCCGDDADDLDAAAGASGAGAADSDEGYDNPAVGVPEHIVLGGETGGGHHADAVEYGAAEAVEKCGDGAFSGGEPVGGGDDDGHRDDGQCQDDDEASQFAVLPEYAHLATEEDEVEQGEVDGGEEHKEGCGEFDDGGVEPPDGVGMCGETSRGDGGEGVVDGVEHTHAGDIEGADADGGEHHIEAPQPACGGADAGMEFSEFQARGLGGEEFLVAVAHTGENGEGEEDDTHTSQPVADAAPEEDGVGEGVNIGEGRGPRGGEAAHCLKERHSGTTGGSAEEKRNHPHDGEDYPGERHNQIAVTTRQAVLGITAHTGETESQGGTQQCGDAEGPEVHFLIYGSHKHTECQQ